MMRSFDDLQSCAELAPHHAFEAASSPDSMRRFLVWAAATARPDEGAPKILQGIAKLGDAGWVEGSLYIDLAGDDSVTKISIFADFGFGIRERLLPLARLSVPFDEFVRAVRLAPKLIAPFKAEQVGGSLVLTPSDAAPGDEADAIVIAESSLQAEAATVPPPGDAGVTKPPPATPEHSGVHTHPTVRRMVAVTPDAYRRRNED